MSRNHIYVNIKSWFAPYIFNNLNRLTPNPGTLWVTVWCLFKDKVMILKAKMLFVSSQEFELQIEK